MAIMVMRAGERWHCMKPECGCTVIVSTDGQIEGENPRCACGAVMKKTYSPPTLSYLDFLRIDEPVVARRVSQED